MVEMQKGWVPYEDPCNVPQKRYDEIANFPGVEHMTDERAKELLHNWYGFDPEKVTILREADVEAKDERGCIRTVGKTNREPLYVASDWHYIFFETGIGYRFELQDDNLQMYSW